VVASTEEPATKQGKRQETKLGECPTTGLVCELNSEQR
jgi:hypothetical protein